MGQNDVKGRARSRTVRNPPNRGKYTKSTSKQKKKPAKSTSKQKKPTTKQRKQVKPEPKQRKSTPKQRQSTLPKQRKSGTTRKREDESDEDYSSEESEFNPDEAENMYTPTQERRGRKKSKKRLKQEELLAASQKISFGEDTELLMSTEKKKQRKKERDEKISISNGGDEVVKHRVKDFSDLETRRKMVTRNKNQVHQQTQIRAPKVTLLEMVSKVTLLKAHQQIPVIANTACQIRIVLLGLGSRSHSTPLSTQQYYTDLTRGICYTDSICEKVDGILTALK
eukprot:gene18716-874_t